MLRHLARAARRPAAAARAPRCASTAGVTGTLRVPGFPLERGSTLDVELVYKTFGSPGKPCILHPTSFDAKDTDLEYAIGPGRILDTDAYFVVVPVRLCLSVLSLSATWRRRLTRGTGRIWWATG